MKKLLLGAAAFGLLSSVAIAEPLKLDDGALGDVAGGFDATSSFSVMVSQMTSTENNWSSSTDTRSNLQDLMSGATSSNYATGLWSEGVTATGGATSSIISSINP